MTGVWAANQAPTAVATASPNPATTNTGVIALTGTASSDPAPGTIASYLWEYVSGDRTGKFSAPGGSTTNFTPDVVSYDWVGTDGAAWPTPPWSSTRSLSAASAATIQGNRGRLAALSGAGGYADSASLVTDAAIPNDQEVEVAVYLSTLNEIYPRVHLRANNAFVNTTYRFMMNALGNSFILQRRVSDVESTLSSVSFTFDANGVYMIRAQAVGTTIRGRIWVQGTTEPSDWTISVTDSDIVSGLAGLGFGGGNTATSYSVEFDNLRVRAA